MSETSPTLKDAVLQEITNGHAKMRPRSYFAFRGTLLALGMIVATLTLLYTISLVLFVTELNGASELPAFGLRGITLFILALPWILILTSLLALVLLELMVQRYAFAYRKPLAYSLLGVILVAIFGGLLVSRFRLHQHLYRVAEEQQVPIARPLYRHYDRQHSKNVYPGVVSELRSNGFYLQTRQAQTYTIIITQETVMPANFIVRPGDMVVVLGPEDDQIITAYGIRPWYSELRNFQPKQLPQYPR